MGVSNQQPHDCLLNSLFRRRSKKTSTLRVTGLVLGIHLWPVNSPHKWPLTRKMFPFDDVIMLSKHIPETKYVILLKYVISGCNGGCQNGNLYSQGWTFPPNNNFLISMFTVPLSPRQVALYSMLTIHSTGTFCNDPCRLWSRGMFNSCK